MSTTFLNNECQIVQISAQPYEESYSNVWFPLRVELSHNRCIETKFRYSELAQFSKALRSAYNINKDQLSKLKRRDYLTVLKSIRHQKNIEKQAEIEKFCQELLQLPAEVTCSEMFFSFFTRPKNQIEQNSDLLTIHDDDDSVMTKIVPHSLKRVFTIRSGSATCDEKESYPEYEFNNRSYMSADTYTNYLPQPTSRRHQQSNVNTARNSIRSSATSSMLFASSIGSSSDELITEGTIKFKVVYDCSNIVIIRIPRSSSLKSLRSQIVHKFALLNIQLPADVVFSCYNSRYSSASLVCSNTLSPESVTLISNEDQFANAMQTKWTLFQKVTLRCKV